jgi:hypothetical protein
MLLCRQRYACVNHCEYPTPHPAVRVWYVMKSMLVMTGVKPKTCNLERC